MVKRPDLVKRNKANTKEKNNKFIEIKGYLTDKFKEKFERFKKQYSKINIILITENEYNKLILKYKYKINYECGGRIKQKFKFREMGIKEIKISRYKPKIIYNLEIEEDSSFIVNGFIVHNTSPHIILPTNKKALKFKVGGKTIFAKVVHHPGTNAQPYFRPAISFTKQKVSFVLKKWIK